MGSFRRAVVRTGLETLYFSGAHVLMRPFVGGMGVILTLHHVRPPRPDPFQPNRLLEVSPRFFARTVRRLKAHYDLVSLDEMHRRVVEGDCKRRFACLTFDDGYRDVMKYAWPVLREHDVPFALYVATSFPDRLGVLWWLGLEAVIARNARIGLVMNGEDRHFDCATVEEKRHLFDGLYWWLRSLETYDELVHAIRDLCARYQVDLAEICARQCMSWEELGQMAEDPRVTIAAHTVNHPMLSKVPEKAARAEMEMSRSVIEAALGVRPAHLSYPVGDPTSVGPREYRIAGELGFKTAVTTNPGMLFSAHAQHLTALPRVSLNGEFQQRRYVKVLMSGAATALWNGFRRVKAA
ncbi:MAG: polysaccharide deacetylase family protein [Pseudorhodoplanes sp.]